MTCWCGDLDDGDEFGGALDSCCCSLDPTLITVFNVSLSLTTVSFSCKDVRMRAGSQVSVVDDGAVFYTYLRPLRMSSLL